MILMAEDTNVRDQLARDRTILSNERTLLSYSRTSLALIGVAAVIFKFADPVIGMIFGALALTAAGFVFFWGVRSYRIMRERLSPHKDSSTTPEELLLAEVE